MRYTLSCTIKDAKGGRKTFSPNSQPKLLSVGEVMAKIIEVLTSTESVHSISGLTFDVTRHGDEMADFDADMERDEKDDK